MTEAIKQWIADQLKEDLKNFTPSPSKEYGYKVGLTKGIEIAEGFFKWTDEKCVVAVINHDDLWVLDCEYFTTSQLLEKYLKQLEK